MWGLREAINWVLKMGFSSVTFKLDAKIIIDVFYSIKLDDSKFGNVVQDCFLFC